MLLADAAEDLLAHKNVPAEHGIRLQSTNLLERLNKGDQAPGERRGDLSASASATSARRGDLDGTGSRMGCGRPPLLQRQVDVPAHTAAATHQDTGIIDGNCLGGERREHLWNTVEDLLKRPRTRGQCERFFTT